MPIGKSEILELKQLKNILLTNKKKVRKRRKRNAIKSKSGVLYGSVSNPVPFGNPQGNTIVVNYPQDKKDDKKDEKEKVNNLISGYINPILNDVRNAGNEMYGDVINKINTKYNKLNNRLDLANNAFAKIGEEFHSLKNKEKGVNEYEDDENIDEVYTKEQPPIETPSKFTERDTGLIKTPQKPYKFGVMELAYKSPHNSPFSNSEEQIQSEDNPIATDENDRYADLKPYIPYTGRPVEQIPEEKIPEDPDLHVGIPEEEIPIEDNPIAKRRVGRPSIAESN
jgi:hypothetical protein